MSITDTQQESPEMAAFKAKWIGKEVQVIDRLHPHFGAIGEVTGVDHLIVGFGMKIKNTQNHSIYYGEEFYIFKGNQIKIL
jgi:hypothetical protein